MEGAPEMACDRSGSARRLQLRAGAGLGPGISTLRTATLTAGISGAFLFPATLGIPDGFHRHHTGQTVVDTQFMKNGVVWGIVSNHPANTLDVHGTLAIRARSA